MAADDAVVVATCKKVPEDDVPGVLVVVTKAAWRTLQGGELQSFDFRPHGIPFRVTVAAAENREAAIAWFSKMASEAMQH